MKTRGLYFSSYVLWLIFFVLAPVALILYQSFIGINGHFTIDNYENFFKVSAYLQMTFNSVLYAALITLITLLISYPTAYFLTKTKYKQLWLMLVILPTWINILLKAYAFIGIFSQSGPANNFLEWIGLGSHQLLFTNASFMLVAAYIQLPFMILPIFNAIDDLDESLINVSHDLGANGFQTFWNVTFPLTLNGIKSGVQVVFIPSLSLFMLTRLIGGNKVITLGTAIEENFLVTQDWGWDQQLV